MRRVMRPPDCEDVFLSRWQGGSPLRPPRRGGTPRRMRCRTGLLHAGVAIRFVVITWIPVGDSAADAGYHPAFSGGDRRESSVCSRDFLLRRWIGAQHLPAEFFERHTGAYRGGHTSPWRRAQSEGLMAVPTRQEGQDDGDGDQDDDDPLQHLHTSGGDLIGHFFINALKRL
jgi:hypothetical protein